MADLTAMMQAAAGAAGEDNLYIEDVFSTYLYTGNGSTQTITNGIDLDGEGGLVWIKSRSAATSNFLFDTDRGTTDEINSDTTDAEASLANSLTAFNSDGFSISSATGIGVSAATYASWTFRKQEKFFDCVTYTGNGAAPRNIPHNLGSTPGCILIKCTNTTGDWFVWHRSMTSTTSNYLVLNSTAAQASGFYWPNGVTDTFFSVNGTLGNINTNGNTYVAYLFAHDAGGFGLTGTDNVISCGNYTGNGSATGPTVTLGYEPQWLMIRRIDNTGDWIILDSKRDVSNPRDKFLEPTTSDAEATGNDVDFNATSFQLKTTSATVNASGGTYIYVVIRADM